MINYIREKFPRQKKIIKFFLVGLTNTAVDFFSLLFMAEILGVSILLANTISFVLAVVNSFFLNKFWTFRNKEKAYFAQFSKFFLISFTGLGINFTIMYFALRSGVWYLRAKFIIIFFVMIWNFLANNLWTFKQTPEKLVKK